jgi:hypothetical protein
MTLLDRNHGAFALTAAVVRTFPLAKTLKPERQQKKDEPMSTMRRNSQTYNPVEAP